MYKDIHTFFFKRLLKNCDIMLLDYEWAVVSHFT